MNPAVMDSHIMTWIKESSSELINGDCHICASVGMVMQFLSIMEGQRILQQVTHELFSDFAPNGGREETEFTIFHASSLISLLNF
jgi:hypothetical protein